MISHEAMKDTKKMKKRTRKERLIDRICDAIVWTVTFCEMEERRDPGYSIPGHIVGSTQRGMNTIHGKI